MSDQTGHFVWYDLHTTNEQEAIDFYTGVTNWSTSSWEEGDQPYTMWMVGERSIGGVGKLSDEALADNTPPHWHAFIDTADIEATSNQAVELGGEVLMPATEIPGSGHYAILRDPLGAVFSIFKSSDENDPPGDPQAGDFSWHEMITDDYEAAFSFYSALFGWEQIDLMDMGEGMMYLMYGSGGRSYGGFYNAAPQMPLPAHFPLPGWLLYINVEDIVRATEKVKELGGDVLHGPFEVPGGDQISICVDPHGAGFALHSAGESA